MTQTEHRLEIIDPEGTVNKVTNPSLENVEDASGAFTPVSSTISRSLDRARFGRASLKIVTVGILPVEGAFMSIDAEEFSEPLTYSVYMRGAGEVRIRMVDVVNGLSWRSKSKSLNDNFWERFEVTGFAGGAFATDLELYVELADRPQTVTFYADGFQVEKKGYATTYADGDIEMMLPLHRGAPFFRWLGARQLSKSERSDRYRRGGRPLNVTKGIYVDLWPTNLSGTGMPPVRTNFQQFVDNDELFVQQQRPLQRQIVMQFFAHKNPALQNFPANLRALHKARQALIDIIKPDRVQETQPWILRYVDGSAPMSIPLYYEAGLEWSGDIRFPFSNNFPLRALSETPFWEVDSQDVCELAFDEGFDSDNLMARINGDWKGWVTNGRVNVIKRHPQSGEIYVGGAFTTIDATTVNRVAIFSPDGDSFRTFSSGPAGIDDGEVFDFGFLLNGDVVVVGEFNNIDTDPFNNIALYDPINDDWSEAGPDPGLDDVIFAVAVSGDADTVYLGGEFTSSFSASVTPLNQICEYSLTADNFSAMIGSSGNGLNDRVNGMDMDLDGLVLQFCGRFTAETGGGADTIKRVGQWDPSSSTFTQLGEDGSDEEVFDIKVHPDGDSYAAGEIASIGFTTVGYVALFNRQEWYPLGNAGDGLSGGTAARSIAINKEGLVLFGGDFDEATDIKSGFIEQLASYDGSRFSLLDVFPDFATGPDVRTVEFSGDDIWVGGVFSDFSRGSSIQTCINNGSARASPILEIFGPAWVFWLENQTTGQVVKFNLQVAENETVMVDMRRGHQRVVSDVRGNLIQDLLPDSDQFDLLPGENKIAFFSRFFGADTETTIHWVGQHWSFDS